MAIVGSAQQVWDGWSLTAEWGTVGTFNVVYEATVDSAQDGPLTLWAASGVPQIGDSYSAGNEAEAPAKCIALNFARKPGKALIWRITATYQARGSNVMAGNFAPVYMQGRDENGNPTDDPLAELLPFRIGSYKRSIPFTKGKNVTAFNPRFSGTEGPITNSAHVPFDPPHEIDYSVLVIYAKDRNELFPPGIIPEYFNAINEHVITLRRAGFSIQCDPYTAKVDDISASLLMRNDDVFWEIEATIAVDSVFGWRPELLDRGMQARAMVGDPDGRGGTISSGDIEDGQPELRAITDFDGRPIQQPVLLDGKGQPLKADEQAVYLTYEHPNERAFDDLVFLLDLN